MKAFVSKTEAIDYVREETGLSIATCTAAVEALPTRRDGKRDKYRASDVLAAADALDERPAARGRTSLSSTITRRLNVAAARQRA